MVKNFAVFASGRGGNLQAIIKAVKNKKINAALAVVFSDKPHAYALVRAKKAGIATLCISPADYPNRDAFDRAVLEELKEYDINFIVLAGYMRLLSASFVKQYANRIINIHPSLLPAFKGTQGIADAFNYGVKVTGVTIHFVTDAMDAGEIIAQEPVLISAKDTLAKLEARIHKVEHKLYPKVIDLFARGKVKITR